MEEKVSIKSFRVHKLENGFSIKKAAKINPFDNGRYQIDWNKSDPYELTLELNKQIYNEYMDMNVIRTICEDDDEENMFVVGMEDGEPTYYKNYNVTNQEKIEGCDKFLAHERDYVEVMSRDEDALEQKDFNVKIYAIVLIVDGIYHGHIYAWISPHNKKYCFAMGIRNRVDTIFTKYRGDNVRNVSGYLLEGVRRYALCMGAESMVIVYPKPIMVKILPTMGFEKVSVDGPIIGTSINPFSFKCNNCYRLIQISKPIITNDINFTVS